MDHFIVGCLLKTMAFEEFSVTAGDFVDDIYCTLHQLLSPKQFVTWPSYLGMLVP